MTDAVSETTASTLRCQQRSPLWLDAGVLLLVAALYRGAFVAAFAGQPPYAAPTGDSQYYMQLAHALWVGRLPPGGFFTSPVYPVYLWLHYVLTGSDRLEWVRTSQLVLSSLVPAMVYLAARFLGASRTASLLVGLLLALSGVLAVYAVAVLPVTVALAASAGTLLFLAVAMRRFDAGRARNVATVAAGVMFGVLCALRPNSLLALPLLALPKGTRLLVLRLAAVAVGVVLLWSGLATAASRRPVLLAENGALNFAIGNDTGANGLFRSGYGASIWEQRGRQPAIGWSDALRRVAARAGSAPTRFAALVGMKLALTWNGYEAPLNVNFTYISSQVGFLRMPWPPLALIWMLGLAGLVLTVRGSPSAVLVRQMALGLALSVAVFFVAGEYRAPLLPWVAVLAALGIQGLVKAAAGPWRHRLAALALAGTGAVLAFAPLKRPYCAAAAINYAASAAMMGRPDLVKEGLKDAVQCDPRLAGQLGTRELNKVHPMIR